MGVSDYAVEICALDSVRVDQVDSPNAKVCELLRDDGTRATNADDSDPQIGEQPLPLCSECAHLPIVHFLIRVALPCAMPPAPQFTADFPDVQHVLVVAQKCRVDVLCPQYHPADRGRSESPSECGHQDCFPRAIDLRWSDSATTRVRVDKH